MLIYKMSNLERDYLVRSLEVNLSGIQELLNAIQSEDDLERDYIQDSLKVAENDIRVLRKRINNF